MLLTLGTAAVTDNDGSIPKLFAFAEQFWPAAE